MLDVIPPELALRLVVLDRSHPEWRPSISESPALAPGGGDLSGALEDDEAAVAHLASRLPARPARQSAKR